MPFNKVKIKNVFMLAVCLIGLLISNQPIQAQSSLNISLESLEFEQFPKITLYLNAYDSLGKFVSGLDLDSFQVFEDGFERTLNEAQELEPGLHTIVALNLGATLSNRKSTAVPTRYEETIFAIASWLNETQSEATNQYSLTSNEGTLVDTSQEKDSFTNTLQNYKPNLYNFEPNLVSLSKALDIAAKPSLVPLSKQAILYITPLPLDQDLNNFAALQARAAEIGVPINVWLVAPDTASNAPAQQYLNQLATATGGKFMFYTEDSEAPNPEDYVGKLRNTYRLRYTSTVSQSGTHTVRVHAQYGNLTAETPENQFSINLSMPSASLINIPGAINREYVDSEEAGGKILQPAVTTLQANIAFPDGYDRQLRATRLYVDGEIVAENTEEPFDYFGWQLDQYRFSDEHLVAVEVEDILGFRSISPQVAIQVNVASLYPFWMVAILKIISLGGWIPLTILALGGAVYVGLRLRKRWLASQLAGASEDSDGVVDPLLQSVPGLRNALDEDYYSNPAGNRSSNQESTPPRLVRVEKSTSADGINEIILEDVEIIVGSDPDQVNIALSSPSISPQHAVLVKSERGSAKVADLGSESGTWVNYAPVSSAGVLLHNGDIIQFGDIAFRYKIGNIQ
jgi:pSer/pThr/pTyr-binding forkhead associated (FHA) protein